MLKPNTLLFCIKKKTHPYDHLSNFNLIIIIKILKTLKRRLNISNIIIYEVKMNDIRYKTIRYASSGKRNVY